MRYELVAMFTADPLGGSPLGVVPDASGLSTEDMRAVAARLGQDETAFVVSLSPGEASCRVRVFNTDGESPYGTHSSLGVATTLVRLGLLPAGRVTQWCGAGAGAATVDVTATGGVVASAAAARSAGADAATLLAACSLTEDDLAAEPRAAGFGAAFHLLPVVAGAVDRAVPQFSRMRAAGLADVCAFHWEPETRTAETRLFAPGYGIAEDPACASVVFGLGVWLAGAGHLPRTDGTHEFTVRRDGVHGRPSTVHGSVTVLGGEAVSATARGRVVPVRAGTL